MFDNNDKIIPQILQKYLGITDHRKIEFTLQHGFSVNECYLFNHNSHQYVLRILHHPNRAYEVNNTLVASKAGIAPKVIFPTTMNGDEHILILDYIESHNLHYNDLQDANLFKNIVKRIKELHHNQCNFTPELTLSYMANYYLQRALHVLNHCWLTDLIAEKIAVTEKKLAQYPQESVPCHGDLNLNNFLMQDNQLYLIDWEDSVQTSCFYDLASFTIFNGLSDEQCWQLLNFYFDGGATEQHFQHLQCAWENSLLMTTAWLARIVPQEKIMAIADKPLAPVKKSEFHQLFTRYIASKNDPNIAETELALLEMAVSYWRSL